MRTTVDITTVLPATRKRRSVRYPRHSTPWRRSTVMATAVATLMVVWGCSHHPVTPSPFGAIHGSALCGTGTPALNASIYISGPGRYGSGPPWITHKTAGRQGGVDVSGLTPGKWFIAAEGYFSCGGMSAESLQVPAGGVTYMTGRLKPRSYLYGTALLQGQGSSTDIDVRVNGTEWSDSVEDSLGHYRIAVPAGTWTVTAFGPWDLASATVTVPTAGNSVEVPPLVLTQPVSSGD